MKSRDETSILDVKSVMSNYGVNTAKSGITVQNPPEKYTAHSLQIVCVLHCSSIPYRKWRMVPSNLNHYDYATIVEFGIMVPEIKTLFRSGIPLVEFHDVLHV